MNQKWIVSAILLSALSAIVSTSRGEESNATDAAEDAKRRQLDSVYAQAERDLTIRLLDRCLSQAKIDAALVADARAKVDSLTKRLTALKTDGDGKRLAA